jgi:hypothetical protein
VLRVLSGDNAEENPTLKELLCSIQIDLIKILNLCSLCAVTSLIISLTHSREDTISALGRIFRARAGGGGVLVPGSQTAACVLVSHHLINTVRPTLKEALNTTINSTIMKFGLFVTILSCSSLFFGGHCIDTEEGTSCTNSDATCTDSPV